MGKGKRKGSKVSNLRYQADAVRRELAALVPFLEPGQRWADVPLVAGKVVEIVAVHDQILYPWQLVTISVDGRQDTIGAPAFIHATPQ